MKGHNGMEIKSLPYEKMREIFGKYNRIKKVLKKYIKNREILSQLFVYSVANCHFDN
jgi:hypothetical protein